MPINLAAAAYVQQLLSKRVVISKLPPVKTAAGLDVAYRGDIAYGAAVVIDVDKMEVVDAACSINKSRVPYVPTYLAFREITPMLRAFYKLTVRPDVVLVDGHGLAHPRGFGIASHIGVVLKIPTIGVAKSRLYGEELGESVTNPATGEEIAKIVQCGGRKRYVSVGSYTNLDEAVALVKKLCVGGDILPLKIAHEITQEIKRAVPQEFDQWEEAPCSPPARSQRQ